MDMHFEEKPPRAQLWRKAGRWGLLLAGWLVAFMAHAGGCFDGPWQGHIGQTPVRMAFFQLPETRDEGVSMPIGISHYRDLSSGQTYLLAGDEARWFVVDRRGRRVGEVQVDCQNGVLNGTWQSPDHRQVRKIQARVAKAEAPRRSGGSWQGLAPDVLSRQASGDLSYEVLGFRRFLGREGPSKPGGDVHGKLRGLRLIGKAPGIAKLNAALEASFVSAFYFYASCVDWHPSWYRDDRTSLVERAGHHVVIRQETADKCDDGSYGFSTDTKTYDLNTGDAIDVLAWFLPGSVKHIYGGLYSMDQMDLNTALGEVLMKAYEKVPRLKDDCKYDVEALVPQAPTAKGILFYAGNRDCAIHVAVPYAQLMPFFTAQGKEGAQTFLRLAATNRSSGP